MKNLDKENIWRDYGEVDIEKIKKFEKEFEIFLPSSYVDFISKHDGASLNARDFDCTDPNRGGRKNGDSITFVRFEEIENDIESLLKQTTEDENDPDPFKFYHYFHKWLVPFGENGGGDFICFDYRENHHTNSPKVILWRHDAWTPDERTLFIANNFEEFVNMLYFDEELEKYLDELYPPPNPLIRPFVPPLLLSISLPFWGFR